MKYYDWLSKNIYKQVYLSARPNQMDNKCLNEGVKRTPHQTTNLFDLTQKLRYITKDNRKEHDFDRIVPPQLGMGKRQFDRYPTSLFNNIKL